MASMHGASIACALSVACVLGCSGGSGGDKSGNTCPRGEGEPNDTPTSALGLGEMTDSPNSTKKVRLLLDTSSDEDFFEVDVKDRGVGGDPQITVSAPAGYEVTTWFTCLTGTTEVHSCRHGDTFEDTSVLPGKACISVAPSASVTSTTDCSGTSDDDGTLLIRVRRKDGPVCSEFEMTIEVE
jgi:hypothetical protein